MPVPIDSKGVLVRATQAPPFFLRIVQPLEFSLKKIHLLTKDGDTSAFWDILQGRVSRIPFKPNQIEVYPNKPTAPDLKPRPAYVDGKIALDIVLAAEIAPYDFSPYSEPREPIETTTEARQSLIDEVNDGYGQPLWDVVANWDITEEGPLYLLDGIAYKLYDDTLFDALQDLIKEYGPLVGIRSDVSLPKPSTVRRPHRNL